MLKLDRHKSIINKGFYNFQLLRSFAISFNNNNNWVDKRMLTNNNFHNQRNNTPITNKQIKQIHTEYNALKKLIQRSFFQPNHNFRGFRQLHSATTLCTNSNQNKNASGEGSGSGVGGSNSNQNSNDKDDKNNKRKRDENEEKLMSIFTKAIMWIFSIYVLIGVLTMAIPNKNQSETSTRYVSWHEFVHHMLANGEVKEIILRPDLEMVTIVLYDGAIVKGRRLHDTIFHMAIADGTKFEEKLRDVEKRLGISTDGIPITYERNADLIPKILITLMVTALIFSIFSRMRGAKSPLSMDSFTQMGRAKFTLVDPIEGGKGVLFKDVAGLQEAKQEVREFVDYLKSPEKYQKLGAKVPKGALLLGPPGCGKTLLAKAVSTEAKVPFLSMNGSEFIEMIGGLGAARVRDLFKEAKNRAPCIIYIDEIDAIGRQRAGVGGSQQFSSGESEQTLNQLLVEMDGMATKQGVLMLASTNRADILDKALLRPGRFDRHILIDLPNLIERREIFEKHLTGIALEHKPSVYSQRLAIITPGFSGADIANVCNEAALHAARHTQKIVNAKNLEYAVERLVGGTEKRSHALTHSERRVIAFHESGHALVGWLLPMSDILQKVTIVPRTSLALGFAQYTPSEQKLFSKEELFDKMCMALGGRAAENITFSRITTGAQNDLEKVTKIAYAQVKKFGMNERIGPMYIHDESDQEYPMSDKPYSKYFDNIIDLEARKIITSAYEKTEKLLKDNENKLRTLAEALLQKENLNYDEVVELIGPPLYETAKRKIDPVEFEQSLKNLSSSDTER